MSKLRKAILIIGILVIAVAASLGTALALYATGSMKTDPIELEFKLKEPQEAKVYDGTPLKLSRVNFDDPYNSDIELSKGKLANGHSIKVEFTGSQTDVGTSTCDANIKIYDSNGFNVTNEYSIKVLSAQLTVVPKTISVELPAQKVVYNGSKVQFDEYRISDDSEGGLCIGHRIYGSTNASLLNVGDTLPADLTPLIFDVAGNDVTANYNIEDFKFDGIEVVKRPVTVRPVSYEKVYDGVELRADEIEFVEGSLVEGQTVEFVINEGYKNKLKDVGETETSITSLKIFESIGDEIIDVTENYEFNLQEYSGLLKVTPRPLTVTAMSATFVYNGEEQSLKDETQAAAVEGLAEGEELHSVSYVSSRTNVGVSANRIGEVKLKSSVDNYNITLIDGTLEITPYEMTFRTYSAEKYYDGAPLSDGQNDCATAKKGHEIIIAESGELPTITDVGEIPNAYEVSVVDRNDGNADCTSNYAITYDYGTLTVKRLPVKVILQSGEDDREKVNYDSKTHVPTLENESYFSVEPILPEDEEVDFNLGYNDFEVVAETRAMCDAGTYYYSVKFKDGKQEERQLYSNYELFVPESGALEITPLPVTVTLKNYTGDNAFTYSGKAVKIEVTEAIEDIEADSDAILPDDVQIADLLTREDFTVVKREIKGEGDAAYTVITSEIIDAGTNYVYTVKIADGSIAKNFAVTISDLKEGDDGINLAVKAMPVTVTLADVNRTYSGEEQNVAVSETLVKIVKTKPLDDNDDVTETGLTAAGLVVVYGKGDRIDAEDYSFVVEIPEAKKKLKNNYELTIKSGNDDERNYAKLIIGKFALEVTTDTCEFTYNGKEQSSGEFTNGALANDGHKIERKTSSVLRKVRNVGDKETNSFDVAVFEGDTEVTKNYSIKYNNGTLSVKPLAITITTDSAEQTYNGRSLKKNTATADVELPTGQKISCPSVNVPELTNVGKIDNVFDCDILSGGVSVIGNYDITYEYGTLEVTPRAITLKTNGIEKVYDGTPLYDDEVTILDGDLVLNYTAKAEKILSITDVGSVENIFDCLIMTNGDEDVTENFEISFAEDCGTLKITPLAINFTLEDFADHDSVDMNYDGKPKKFDVKQAIKSITEDKYAPKTYKVNESKTGTELGFCEDDFEIVYNTPIIDAGAYVYTVRFTDETFRNNFKIENEDEQLSCIVRVKQKKLRIVLKSFTGADALVFGNGVQEIDIYNPDPDNETVTIFDADNSLAEVTSISVDDFVAVYPEPLLNAGNYKYKVKIEDEALARNFLIGDPEGDVTIERFDVYVYLKNCEATYSGKEFVFPEDAAVVESDYLSDGTEVTDLVKSADFTFAAVDGSPIIDVRNGNYEYGATFADETKARNFRINVVTDADYEATVKILQKEVSVSLKHVPLTFNGKVRKIEEEDVLDKGDETLLTVGDFTFEVMRDGEVSALFKAGEYTYTATLTNGNFKLKEDESGKVSGNVVGGGTAVVGQYEVTVTLKDFDKEYDGRAYVLNPRTSIFAVYGSLFGVNDFEVAYDEETPLDDHSDAGDYTLKVMLIDKYDDISDSVKIITENNVFTIRRKQLTLKTGSASREYNGEALNSDEIICYGGLIAGHRCVATEENLPDITEVGEKENRYEGIAIVDENDRAVTGNYAVSYEYGKLEIKAVEIAITFNENINKDYTGRDITLSGNDVIGEIKNAHPSSEGTLPATDDFVVIYAGEAVNAGTYTFTVEIKAGSHPERYVVPSKSGSFTVNKLSLAVTLKNCTGALAKEYSGEAYEPDENDAAVDASAENNPDGITGYDLTFDYPVMLNAGTYTYGVKITDETLRGNYKLVFERGTVVITPADITVTLKNYTKTYNGKAYTVDVADAVISIKDAAGNDSTLLSARDLAPVYTEELRLADDAAYSYTVGVADGAKAKNFNITKKNGEFKIDKRKLTFTVANVYMSSQEYNEMYVNEYSIDVTENVSVSMNTPLADGDQLIVNGAVAERTDLSLMTFYLNAFVEGEIELTNRDCYEFTNVTGDESKSASVQLIIY